MSHYEELDLERINADIKVATMLEDVGLDATEVRQEIHCLLHHIPLRVNLDDVQRKKNSNN